MIIYNHEVIMATIQNVVSTGSLSTKIDLVTLAWMYSGKYVPKSFAACQLRISYPKTTALIFASGKIVCTGARSVRLSRIAMYVYMRMVCKIHKNARLRNVHVQNLVASSLFKYKINLKRLHDERMSIVQYDPDIFPGARVTLSTNDMHASVFLSGKLIISGAKNEEDVKEGLREIREICKPYYRTEKTDIDTDVEHRDITITLQSLRGL